VAYGTIEDLKFEMAKGAGGVSLEEAFLRITTAGAAKDARSEP
jgi:hypothetical protein